MSFARALRCRECGRDIPSTPSTSASSASARSKSPTTTRHAAQVITRETHRARPASLWRYADLLPVEGERRRHQAGFTPLIRAENLGEQLGLNNLYLKNDCANPTWSFKDRVVAVAATKAREFGFDTSPAPRPATWRTPSPPTPPAPGMEAFVFVPSDLEAGKILGSTIYGANLVAVDGNYDDVNRLCAELGDKYPLGVRQHQLPPLLLRGQQDAGLRGRGAARLARAGPLRRADGLRLALRQDLEGPAGVRSLG